MLIKTSNSCEIMLIGTSTILLSFVTETVTVTAVPQTISQVVTITAAAGGTTSCVEAAGTGDASLAETAAAAKPTCGKSIKVASIE
jgi:hypothetical protein